VLDTAALTFRIYIWYEDGHSVPSLVKLDGNVELALPIHREVPRSDERRHRVSVPGGSHE
jgi:hypothetical protein